MKALLLSTFLAVLYSQATMGQCCSAGNPYFYNEHANMGHKELQVSLGYKYSTSNTYYKGSDAVSINFIDKAYFNFMNLQILYGLSPRFSIQTDFGYFINKTEKYELENWSDNNGYGLGDASLTVKYLAYKNFKRHLTIVPSVRVKFPIGVFDQEAGHVKLPITVQPSSGSYKYALNLYIGKGFSSSKWSMSFFGSFEYAQLIASKNFYYKYGNQYLFAFLISNKISDKLNLGLELRNESRAKSKRENQQIVASTGYQILYAVPHLSYSITNKWLVALNTEWPFYRHYNGLQLGNKFAVSASFYYRFMNYPG
ncbi:MAG: hypothetical protein U5Q03_04980 [Bacteroidota bacterium]|nr:hypothetical protein [Bacteroidota bacterium]